ncbi:MAG: NADH-quinone oxidoreductase subunit L [Chloroflexi bacterium RBG_16_56_11]|nr:MAG: NADH-quinone oxidoreductase subunit L [Chloroflexi bacterium RBG_16_56_11]
MGLAAAFWIMAVVIVAAALGVVFLRNVFRAALTLVLCFVAVAGLYITLSADFLAAVQILVYVGAISVLIILAIMMTREVPQGSPANRLKLPAFIVAAVVLGIMIYTVTKTAWQVSAEAPLTPTTVPLATKLFSEGGFVLPVEIAAVLLLAAILGAIVIAREK